MALISRASGAAECPAGHPRPTDGPADTSTTLALAHGAGQGMDSAFMAFFAGALGERGIRVVRFDFPYMARMKAEGRRRPPDRQPVLLDTWRALIRRLEAEGTDRGRLLIGGKSMGGRMASLIADAAGVAGLVCLGYPFHPPGRPDKTRIGHLAELRTPTLICQGERDPFGTRAEVSGYPLSDSIRILWLPDGDHGLRPRRQSGLTETGNRAAAVAAIAAFAEGVVHGRAALTPQKITT